MHHRDRSSAASTGARCRRPVSRLIRCAPLTEADVELADGQGVTQVSRSWRPSRDVSRSIRILEALPGWAEGVDVASRSGSLAADGPAHTDEHLPLDELAEMLAGQTAACRRGPVVQELELLAADDAEPVDVGR